MGKIDDLKKVLPSIPDAHKGLREESIKSFCGPCPKCQGYDRFVYRTDTQRFWCRQCQARGDVIAFHAWIEDTDIKGLMKKYLPNSNKKYKKTEPFEHYQLGSPIGKYPYTDSEGNVLYYNCRFEPKAFRQCNADGTSWSTKNIKPKVPYQLSKIIDSETVFIVEGERDCHSLAKLNLVGTTNVAGAGNWTEDLNEHFKGKELLLIGDNDDAGRRHIADVYENLKDTAASIKLIKLSGLKEGGDITDWLNTFEDKNEVVERLAIITEGAEPYRADKELEKDDSQKNRREYHLTDMGNAERLADGHGQDLMFCHLFNKWLVWDGTRWADDNTGKIKRKCKDVVRGIYAEAAKLADDEQRKKLVKYAMGCESDYKIKAMISLAKSENGIPVLPEQLDTNPYLLNCQNGTVDLKTGELRLHNRGDLITKLAPVIYDPTAECHAWLDHLYKIMAGNEALIGFLQRAFGYSLTGDSSERKIFIEFGSGANGKTITNDTIALALGDYAMRTPTETLLIKRNEGIPNDVARLRGARFVYASEAEQGKRLAESLIKDMSGGEKITARFMRAEWFEFYPEFKIWLGTNHKPIIRGTDHAIWDRIRLIPFTVRIPEHERIPRTEMLELFKQEMGGILAWLVEGCLAWQREGLGVPEEVEDATNEYRAEMDILNDFIYDRCITGSGVTATAKVLFEEYESWAEDNGEKAISKKLFGMKLSERGFEAYRATRGVRTWRGIGVTRDA